MRTVMIHPADYDNCRRAVDRAFELFPQKISKAKVLIKPNVLRLSKANEHIVTNPALLKAVVEKVEEMHPAQIIVGDNPGMFSYGDNENCFEKTGLMTAAKGYYKNIGNTTRQFAFNPEYMPRVGVSQDIAAADVFISLCKFKTHGLTVMTGAIKNSFGILPGAQKARLHHLAGTPERFHEVIVDVFRLKVPDLFIMDAVTGMEGNGPASPDLRDIGKIIASDNAVALDAVVARMMGLDPGRLRFLQKAKSLGLGDFDETAIRLEGALEVIEGFKLPPLGGEAVAGNPEISELIRTRTHLRPKVNPDLCTGCEDCINHCPVSALSMGEAVPEADEELCITCFCCQEICQEKAITLQ